jgi:hypothetical protein
MKANELTTESTEAWRGNFFACLPLKTTANLGLLVTGTASSEPLQNCSGKRNRQDPNTTVHGGATLSTKLAGGGIEQMGRVYKK